jgi:hypothetical protein
MKTLPIRALCAAALLFAPALAYAHPTLSGPHIHEQTVHSRGPQIHNRDASPHRAH